MHLGLLYHSFMMLKPILPKVRSPAQIIFKIYDERHLNRFEN